MNETESSYFAANVATVEAGFAGGDEGFQYWWDRLAAVTGRYSRVLMLGDSMGATAALMFSPLATAVHAFTPQAGSQSLAGDCNALSVLAWPHQTLVRSKRHNLWLIRLALPASQSC